VLPLDVAKTLASGIVGSKLDYSISVLYGAPNSTESAKLSRSCRTATPKDTPCSASTEIVTMASHFSSNQLQTGDLDVQNTFNVPTDIFVIRQLIHRQFTGSSMSLRSSQRLLLQVPRTRTAYGSHAFSVTVPNIWNKLPADVLAVNSLPVFVGD